MDFDRLRSEWAKTSLQRVNSNIVSAKEELENLRKDYEVKEVELFGILEQRRTALTRLEYNEYLKDQGDSRVEADASVWVAQKTVLESRYEDISFSNDSIIIKTKAVTCETDYPAARGYAAKTVVQLLGKFIIKVHWKNSVVTIEPEAPFKNWTATKGDPNAGDTPLYHPNIFDSKPCWGRHGGEVGRMLKDNDINAFLFFIYNFLSASNSNDQYLRLDATRVLGKCVKCTKFVAEKYFPNWKKLEANVEFGIPADTLICSKECENKFYYVACDYCGTSAHRTKLVGKKYCSDNCYLIREGIPCGNKKCKKKILPTAASRYCSEKCETQLNKCDQCGAGTNVKVTMDGVQFCSLSHLYDLIRKPRCPSHGEPLTPAEFIANSVRIDWASYSTAKPLGFTCAQHYNQKNLTPDAFAAVTVPWEKALSDKKLPEAELTLLQEFINTIKNVPLVIPPVPPTEPVPVIPELAQVDKMEETVLPF